MCEPIIPCELETVCQLDDIRHSLEDASLPEEYLVAEELIRIANEKGKTSSSYGNCPK